MPSRKFALWNRQDVKQETEPGAGFRVPERKSKYPGTTPAEYQRRLRQDTWAFVASIKDVPCMDCGETFPSVCMDFDHVRGEKKFNIGMYRSTSQAALLAEIAKCDIVCSNCHRIRTQQRRDARRSDTSEVSLRSSG